MFQTAVARARLCLRFELDSCHARLPNYRLKRAEFYLGVIRDGHSYCRTRQAFLHNDVTATLPNLDEPMFYQNLTHLLA